MSRSHAAVIVLACAVGGGVALRARTARTPASARAAAPRSATAVGAIPAMWEENVGQVGDARIRFASHGARVAAFVSDDGTTILSVPTPGGGSARVEMRLAGAAPSVPAGEDRVTTRVRRYVGDRSRWLEDVPAWRAARARNVYPGVDLVVHAARACARSVIALC